VKRTLGVIGGMGPLATVKLFERIVLSTEAKSDQEHLHIIIDNNTNISDRTKYILKGTDNPLDELIISAKKLEDMGADFIIMPCNTAHYFIEEIRKNIKIPFISMIEETAKHIIDNYPGIRNLGLLATEGTYSSRVYNNVFDNYGLNVYIPNKDNQGKLMNFIYDIKRGIYTPDFNNFNEPVKELLVQGAELFILGCTELSVAYDLFRFEGEYLDAMDVIVKRSIEYAGAKSYDTNTCHN
jgi:aspartate racemase